MWSIRLIYGLYFILFFIYIVYHHSIIVYMIIIIVLLANTLIVYFFERIKKKWIKCGCLSNSLDQNINGEGGGNGTHSPTRHLNPRGCVEKGS